MSRPVPSMRPHRLAGALAAAGVDFITVGSTARGGPARDLDLLLDPTADNLDRLTGLLTRLGLGDWPGALRRFETMKCQGPVTIETDLGLMDLHRA